MSALSQAMHYWTNGRRCPLHIAALLIEQGYDVKALEELHRV